MLPHHCPHPRGLPGSAANLLPCPSSNSFILLITLPPSAAPSRSPRARHGRTDVCAWQSRTRVGSGLWRQHRPQANVLRFGAVLGALPVVSCWVPRPLPLTCLFPPATDSPLPPCARACPPSPRCWCGCTACAPRYHRLLGQPRPAHPQHPQRLARVRSLAPAAQCLAVPSPGTPGYLTAKSQGLVPWPFPPPRQNRNPR